MFYDFLLIANAFLFFKPGVLSTPPIIIQSDTIKNSTNLSIFHKELQKHEETMLERYGWIPKYEARMASDTKAAILAFAITEDGDIAGMACMLPLDIDKIKELIGINDDINKRDNTNIRNINDHMDALFASDNDEENDDEKYEENYEIAMVVLPKYQRRGIGTKLTQQTYEKFGKPSVRCIGIVQSQKSAKFMEKVKMNMGDIPLVIVNPQHC